MKPGIAYGQTDELGYEAVEHPMHVHDLHATILHLLGLDHERLTYRYAGRDMRLTDVKGWCIEGSSDKASWKQDFGGSCTSGSTATNRPTGSGGKIHPITPHAARQRGRLSGWSCRRKPAGACSGCCDYCCRRRHEPCPSQSLRNNRGDERRGVSPPWKHTHGGLTPRRSPDSTAGLRRAARPAISSHPLSGLTSRHRTPRTIEGDGNPAVDPPKLAADLLHPALKKRVQERHEAGRPRHQRAHLLLP